jgi:hypothetical protein
MCESHTLGAMRWERARSPLRGECVASTHIVYRRIVASAVAGLVGTWAMSEVQRQTEAEDPRRIAAICFSRLNFHGVSASHRFAFRLLTQIAR